jgi:hypothetical protein
VRRLTEIGVESISQKGGNSIAVNAIVRVALRQSFQTFGASRGRGTHDRRGAFCPDRLRAPVKTGEMQRMKEPKDGRSSEPHQPRVMH